MKFWSSICVLAAAACLLLSCSTSSSGSEKAWNQFTSNFYDGLEPANSLDKVKIPILRSPAYGAKWGKPKIRVSFLGDYELNYENPAQPFDRLVIHGSVRPFPKLTKAPDVSGEDLINGELTGVTKSQSFQSVLIEGQTVKWFQESTSGGADGAYFTTEGFMKRGSFGSAGHYRIVVESGDEMEAEVARRFGSAKISR